MTEDFAGWVDAYVSSFGSVWGEAHAFSGYVLVARAGAPVFAKAYGRANRTSRAIADADTRFRIGSVTKQFTAVAILTLVEKGLVRLGDTVSRYVSGLSFGDRVTLHHCLTHTSGIASYTDDADFMKEHDRPHTREQVVDVFRHKPLQFEPGAEFRYSNSNYFLLGMVIEKAAGRTYEDYLQSAVLGPARMTRTSTIDAPDAPNTAVGYTCEGEELVPAGAVDMSNPFAAGALRSTANDLVRWDRALAGDALLSEDSKRRMATAVRGNYGYGIGTSTIDGHEVHGHGGGIDGFICDYARVPDEGLAIAVLSNVESMAPFGIFDAILRMAIGGRRIDPPVESAPVPLDATTVSRFTGTYEMDAESNAKHRGKVPDANLASIQTITISEDQQGLWFKPNGQRRAPLFLRGDGRLFMKLTSTTLEAEPPDGRAEAIVARQGGFRARYVRVQPQ